MSFFISKKIRYFITVMNEKNLSQAAEKLHITRSPLGKSISDLESNIGCKLFTRNGNHLTPTEYGINLYNKINPICESIISIEERFTCKKNKNQLRIYVDDRYPKNLYDIVTTLQYIKGVNVRVERKPFNETTLLEMGDDYKSAFLTLRKNDIVPIPGYSYKNCTTRIMHFIYADNQKNKSKNIEDIIASHPVIKGKYVSDDYFTNFIACHIKNLSSPPKYISEDFGLTATLNLVINDEAVTFIPDSFLRYCSHNIACVPLEKMTMTPQILYRSSSAAYFDKIIKYINSN